MPRRSAALSPRASKAEASGATARSKRKRPRTVVVNLANCKYAIVEHAVRERGWVVDKDPDSTVRGSCERCRLTTFHATPTPPHATSPQAWNLMWMDTSVSAERAMRLKRHQKLNHFPGMHILARKVRLSRLALLLLLRISHPAVLRCAHGRLGWHARWE